VTAVLLVLATACFPLDACDAAINGEMKLPACASPMSRTMAKMEVVVVEVSDTIFDEVEIEVVGEVEVKFW